MRKFNITVNGNTYEVDVEEIGGVVTSAPVQAPVTQAAPAPAPQAAPASAAAPAPAPKPAAPAPAGAKSVVAPMPGTIVSVKVSQGQAVTKDTVVAILEAMKMENEIFAGVDGTVASVSVSAGQSINTGDTIVSIN